MNSDQLWFIPEVSKGLGLALVNGLLEKGYKVVAPSGKVEDLRASDLEKLADVLIKVFIDQNFVYTQLFDERHTTE